MRFRVQGLGFIGCLVDRVYIRTKYRRGVSNVRGTSFNCTLHGDNIGQIGLVRIWGCIGWVLPPPVTVCIRGPIKRHI